MSGNSKIGRIDTGRISQVHAANIGAVPEIPVRSAAKDDSIDIDPNA
jgi:hypothetical protein